MEKCSQPIRIEHIADTLFESLIGCQHSAGKRGASQHVCIGNFIAHSQYASRRQAQPCTETKKALLLPGLGMNQGDEPSVAGDTIGLRAKPFEQGRDLFPRVGQQAVFIGMSQGILMGRDLHHAV